MQTDMLFWDSLVFDGIDDVDVEAATAAFGTVEVTARGRAAAATCPDCGHISGRVHDSYRRRLKDLPLGGQSVMIRLTVRRFICDAGDCSRRTFTEPFAQLTRPYARFTTRLNHLLERVGLALAGRAGARLASQLGMSAGRMTLLRRVVALPDPLFSTPRVLGVDDFATRRGQIYSTVLTCGETHRVVDVLPTRTAGPLAAWLTAQPGVEIICRDRAGAYAEGARLGAPDALQVADRFHLRQGLGRAMETCVAAHRECLRPSMSDEPPPSIPQAAPTPLHTEPAGRRAQRKKAAHALVHELLAQGRSRRAIARHLGWGLNTVLRYASAARWQDTLRDNRPRPSRLDPHKPHLDRRLAEGCTSVTQLHRELVAQGAPVTYGMVRAYIATLRAVPPDAPPPPPSVRKVTGWLTRHPISLSEEDRAGLKNVLARCPELATAAGHIRDFGEILTDRLGTTLPTWIDAVDTSQLPGLTGFALHLHRDLDAVTAGLTLEWSSGATEGAVNRIKKIKRQLYGRAGFELLRKMILLQ
ncbi:MULTISPECIES: ISL3 family transposase [unclassified Streptomyces]|uniref:ISL3 family transposase n=1 Tax=unclassified Streptomyces TaxID=2593676 RepID=UPI0022523CA4|nr:MULTISPECIES: ISL3 family transposase [unclassified Streptomyces]MCX4869824.1 ISL3 family transposase [Streptomyces sp. NBC_00906]MCX4900987.1 ISL3 family transposase [Streptomyces sp. NBC_00892]